MAKTKKNGKQAKKAGATSPKRAGTIRQRAVKAAATKKTKDEKKRAGVKTADEKKRAAAKKRKSTASTDTSSSEPKAKKQKMTVASRKTKTAATAEPEAKKRKTARKIGATGGAAAKAPTRRVSPRMKKAPVKSSAGKRNSKANAIQKVAAAAEASSSTKYQVIKATDPSKGRGNFYKKIIANATIATLEWMAQDEANKKCIIEGFCRRGDPKKKELIAILYKKVYSKLPRTETFRDLRSSDFLSKRGGDNLGKLLARCNLRTDCIQGTNKGKPSSYYIDSNKFKIKAQKNLDEGTGVAALLDLTPTARSGFIGLVKNGRVPTRQFKSIDAALSCVVDALIRSDVMPDAQLPATLSAEAYQELCKSIDPDTEANKLLDAIGRRDASSLRCQSGACLQVAMYCLAVRLHQRRVLAVKSKDGKQIDFGSMVSIILCVFPK